ncbi:MAG: hypothetical protein RLW68_01465 [Devosia marina]|uniref:hypothetical protein n=1 Tax=Devosia marina TaxID=2683198 RepID=UPI0032EC3932
MWAIGTEHLAHLVPQLLCSGKGDLHAPGRHLSTGFNHTLRRHPDAPVDAGGGFHVGQAGQYHFNAPAAASDHDRVLGNLVILGGPLIDRWVEVEKHRPDRLLHVVRTFILAPMCRYALDLFLALARPGDLFVSLGAMVGTRGMASAKHRLVYAATTNVGWRLLRAPAAKEPQ